MKYFLSVFMMVFMYEILTSQNNDTILKGTSTSTVMGTDKFVQINCNFHFVIL